MAQPGPHEALIYLMVITSASDRDMTNNELARIGQIVRSWPVFVDFDDADLIGVAQDCQKLLQASNGLENVLTMVSQALPERLSDTAYALAVEVAAVDLELRMEEVRILQHISAHLGLGAEMVRAIEFATKARHRMLT